MRTVCIVIIALFSVAVFAQNNSKDSYLAAEEAYRDGLFDKAIHILEKDMKGYDNMLISSVYRLLALSYMALDREEKADEYVRQLLKYLPYYTVSLQDPERFADLIRKYKEGKRTLVTASQQIETLEEVPVPVTLITEEMIQDSGARNLKELLLAYVPGISGVENVNEMNIAMHGIYSSGQQKILIMQDGHRLNSRSTNSASPDYSMGLNKIKQVEVLRAPGSSLYGNVALTAVINLITKEGTDINGFSLSIARGSYHSMKADLLLGKHLMEMDFIAWASCYSSNGERVFISKEKGYNLIPSDGYSVVGGFNGAPSYDLGFKFQWESFHLSAALQHGKMIQPFSPLTSGTFSYDNYVGFAGKKPGSSRKVARLEAGYIWNKAPFSMDVSVYADFEEACSYDVAGDTIPPMVPIVPTGTTDTIYSLKGVFQILDWEDQTYGVTGKLKYDYQLVGQKGNFIVGAQYELYQLGNTSFRLGDHFNRIVWTADPPNERLCTGIDRSISFFLQGKQYLGQHLLLNAGIRYDHKVRSDNKKKDAFSPRLSVIYLMNKVCNLKVGYSHSFVDAPYFYRNNTTRSYRGGSELKPELMDAFYLNFAWNPATVDLHYDCNLYYNHVSHLIYKSPKGDVPYLNAGKVNLVGLENSLNFHQKNLFANLTISYMRLLDAHDYNFSGHRIKGIPEFSTHLVIGYDILPAGNTPHVLRLQGNLTGYSRQNGLSGRILVNTGVTYSYHQKLEISGYFYNLFNTSYQMDGEVTNPISQPGRWFLGKITIKI